MSNDLTSVAVRQDTKEKLDDLKEHEKESYESVISRLVSGEGIESVEVDGERMALVTEIREQLDRLDSEDSTDTDELEDRIVSRIAREQSTDLEQFETEIKKAQRFAEEAKNNTEEIKQGLR